MSEQISTKPNITLQTDAELTNRLESTVNQILGKIEKFSNRFTTVITKCKRTRANIEWISSDVGNLKMDKPVTQQIGRIPNQEPVDQPDCSTSSPSAQTICQQLVAKSLEFAEIRSHRVGVSEPLIVTDIVPTPVVQVQQPKKIVEIAEPTESPIPTPPPPPPPVSLKIPEPPKMQPILQDSSEEEEEPELVEIEKNAKAENLEDRPADLQSQLASELFAKINARKNLSDIKQEEAKSVAKGAITNNSAKKDETLNNNVVKNSSKPTTSTQEIVTSSTTSSSKMVANTNDTTNNIVEEKPSSPVIFRNTGRLSPKAITREDTEAVVGMDLAAAMEAEKEEIKKKSVFEAESDDDLFQSSALPKPNNVPKIDEVVKPSAKEEKITTQPKTAAKKKVSSIFDDSSDSGEDSLFKSVVKKPAAIKNGVKKTSVFVDDMDDDSLFRTTPTIEQKKEPISNLPAPAATLPRRSPGKLDVGSIGGKLNSLLLAGPGGPIKPAEKTAPKTENSNNAVSLEGASVIGALKTRARGPANRRPPTRSMVMTKSELSESTSKVKKTASQDEIIDPLSL